MATLGIPQNTIAVLQKYHFNFQKKFGQNFLIDTHVLERIIEAAGITKMCIRDRSDTAPAAAGASVDVSV